jgi:glycosyltransferase involved in cell wall biosynthesis
MKFSVITPCYNSGATIGRTLRSVAEQAHVDIEHIVIDGGSSDDTAQIVEAGLRPGGHFLSERDDGIYDAMNKGLALATGDVVGILNADDYLADPTALSWVADAFSAHRPDAVLGDVAFFSAQRPDRLFRRYRSASFRPDRLAWGWMPAHPGMYLTREAYRRVGLYRTDFRIAADYEFAVRAFAKHRLSFVHLPRILVHMQAGGVSNRDFAAKLLINREVLRACSENGIYSNALMIASKYPRKLLEYFR